MPINNKDASKEGVLTHVKTGTVCTKRALHLHCMPQAFPEWFSTNRAQEHSLLYSCANELCSRGRQHRTTVKSDRL